MRRRGPWLGLWLGWIAACASTAPPAISVAEESPRPRQPAEDLVEVSLMASGYDDAAERAAAKAELEKRAAPILAEVGAIKDPRDRAAKLLLRLHGDRGLLGSYETRATTLRDVLERRRFNCVSASLLYGVLGARLGLDLAGQLLPTHARSLAYVDAARKTALIVETTSPHGFDPSPEALKGILKDVGMASGSGERTLVSEKGLVVPTLMLAAAMYVNRGSLAQEAGDLTRAEQLFARAELISDDSAMRAVLRDQRAALMTQLAVDDLLAGDPARLPRAYRSMLSAVKIAPKDPETRSTVQQNLRAAAERLLAQAGERGDEAAIEETRREIDGLTLDPGQKASIAAFAWSELSRLRGKAGDFEGALTAIDRGVEAAQRGVDDTTRPLLEKNRVSLLRMAALAAAKAGDTEKSRGYLARLEALPAADKQELVDDQVRTLVLAAQARYAKKDLSGALELYREAHRRAPQDPDVSHNVLALLEERVVPEINANRCEAVAAELAEIRQLAPRNSLPDQAEARCLVGRAAALLETDEAAAVELLRQASRLQPKDARVRQNLLVGLTRLIKSELKARRCADARSAAAEALAIDRAKGRALAAEVGKCR
ncbi:MAG: transglutaminase family protein [Myxococcota bacterium]